jgi:hypothetical protein
MMHLVRAFSVLLMSCCGLFTILFTILYFLGFLAKNGGIIPPLSFVFLAGMAFVSRVMWKVSSSEIKKSKGSE